MILPLDDALDALDALDTTLTPPLQTPALAAASDRCCDSCSCSSRFIEAGGVKAAAG